MIVYVSIGNSDDKLAQQEWAAFVHEIVGKVVSWAAIVHGAWFSLPDSMFQNACWCLDFPNDASVIETVKNTCSDLAVKYRQNSISWAPVDKTEFL